MTHDPKTVLCSDCKHSVHYQHARLSQPYSCNNPLYRSVIDGGSVDIISTRIFKCKGEQWEEKPPDPPPPIRIRWWERLFD